MHYDVLIIGGGAAGLNAALLLGRARRTVAVCDDGRPRNRVVRRTHGFLSRDGCPPGRFIRRARADVARYPSVTFVNGTVARAIAEGEGFSVHMNDGRRCIGDRLLLANGVKDVVPPIQGLERFWGQTVFVCPFCDGWEVRGRRLVVTAKDAKNAIHLAQELYQWSRDVSVCAQIHDNLSHDEERWLERARCTLVDSPVKAVRGIGRSLKTLQLCNGQTIDCEALFVAGSLRQSCPIAAGLGCAIGDDGMLVVDDDNQTTVRGCYGAGDAVTSVHQLVVAAASGVRAAIAITADLVAQEVSATTGRTAAFP